MKNFMLLLCLSLGVAAVGQGVNAATKSVTANIAFDTAIALTKNADIDFGIVEAGVADTYTITTGAAVTAAGVGEVLGGSPAAGDITIVGSAAQTVAITVGSLVANNGVTPANITCAYDGGGSAACALAGQAAPGAGKTLLLGADAVVDGTQAAGSSAAPTFVVTVVYG